MSEAEKAVIEAARAWRAEDRRFTFANAEGSTPAVIVTRQFNRREAALDRLARALEALDTEAP